MTHASSGIRASLLTAVITPREMITVALSMRGPETGTTVAPRIAKYCGSPPCPAILGAATRKRPSEAVRASHHLGPSKWRIRTPCLDGVEGHGSTHHFVNAVMKRTRLVASYRTVKALAVYIRAKAFSYGLGMGTAA